MTMPGRESASEKKDALGMGMGMGAGKENAKGVDDDGDDAAVPPPPPSAGEKGMMSPESIVAG